MREASLASVVVIAIVVLAGACDLGGPRNCGSVLGWSVPTTGTAGPGAPIVGVSSMRVLLEVDFDDVVASSRWEADVIVRAELSFGVRLRSSMARATPIEELIQSLTLDGPESTAAGRSVGGEVEMALLPMPLYTCRRHMPCHVEFTVTIRFTDRFVFEWGQDDLDWGSSVRAITSEPIPGTPPDCESDALRGHVTFRTTVLEIVPGAPGGGLVGMPLDGGRPADAATDGG